MKNAKFRFEILDLILLIGLIGSSLAIWSLLNGEKVVWNSNVFSYDNRTSIPEEFLREPQVAVEIKRKWFSVLQYRDGEHLYRENFDAGWEECREAFYYRKNWQKAPPFWADISEGKDLEWNEQHIWRARSDGWKACRNEIIFNTDLLNDIEEFRSKIGYSNRRYLPPATILLVLSTILLISRHRRKAGTC